MVTSYSLAGLVLLALLLWSLSVWQAKRVQSLLLVAASASLIAACIGLVVYSLFFSASLASRARFPIEVALQYALVPVFLALPAAVSFCASQLLIRNSVSTAKARIAGILGGAFAAVIVPFAALAAGCSLAGACL